MKQYTQFVRDYKVARATGVNPHLALKYAQACRRLRGDNVTTMLHKINEFF